MRCGSLRTSARGKTKCHNDMDKAENDFSTTGVKDRRYPNHDKITHFYVLSRNPNLHFINYTKEFYSF